MHTVVRCGILITGNGKTCMKNKALWIKGGKFIDITNYDAVPERGDLKVISAENDLVAPGAVNYHAHGCTLGPLFPSAALPLSKEEVISNLRRHLSQGTTTVCNVCGFSLAEEIEGLEKEVPVKLHIATAHTRSNIKAAEIADGKGLKAEHRSVSIRDMVEAGAVAVGEIGGGHTLGGGGQDYFYIPRAVKARTGIEISPFQARELKFAVLGRNMNAGTGKVDYGRIEGLLNKCGLSGKITVDGVIDLIRRCVLPSVQAALKGYEEAYSAAEEFCIPLILHNSAPSVKKIEEILFKNRGYITVIAAHCNHDTFEVEEAVRWAQRLKELGAIIDLATFDITRKSRQNTGGAPDYFDAMAQSGIADIISTDYNGGWWDGIYEGISRIIKKGYSDICRAVALGTGNVRNAVPLLAKDCGLIKKGFAADFVITEKDDIGKIKRVFVNGIPCYENKAKKNPGGLKK